MSGERSRTDVTRLLGAVRAGDREALNELYALVYAELRVLARRQRQRWHETGTLNTTALVHEAYVKLVHQRRLDTSTPEHFIAIAATAIRHIISNYARDRRAKKRGRDVRKISLSELGADPAGSPPLSEASLDVLIAVDEALEHLDVKGWSTTAAASSFPGRRDRLDCHVKSEGGLCS